MTSKKNENISQINDMMLKKKIKKINENENDRERRIRTMN